MEEEPGCSFRRDRRVRWNEVYSFGDSIHDRHDSVMSGRLREFDHKIDTEGVHRASGTESGWSSLTGLTWAPESCVRDFLTHSKDISKPLISRASTLIVYICVKDGILENRGAE